MLNGQLVNTPAAADFFALASTGTGRRVLFGDKGKFAGTRSFNAITFADNATQDALAKMVALQDDKTRPTALDKHVAAKAIAERTVNVIAESKDTIAREGAQLIDGATNSVEERFPLNASRSMIYDKVMNWINERGRAGEVGKIREQANNDPDIVTVLIHMPGYLFDLSNEVRSKLTNDAITHYLPKASQDHDTGAALIQLAAKYDRPLQGVRNYFYSEAVAAGSASRVEVA